MPHRSYASTANYRFGFNGKDNDNEPKGLGNQQDYGMRIYDPRIAKFLSVDPLTADFPWYTPYQFAGNMPINSIDLDGAEPKSAGKENNQTERAPDREGKMQNWSWSSKEKVWTMLLDQVTVTAYSKNFRKPISNFLRAYYDDKQWQDVLSIGGDLANLLFLKELNEKIPKIPGMPDVKSTYEGIKSMIKDKELKSLIDQSENLVKNRNNGMEMAKEGTINLITALVPVKKLGDALRLLDKTLVSAGISPIIADYNLVIASSLDLQLTHLQFEYVFKNNAYLMKHDHMYMLPVTYRQFSQIMNLKFIVLDNFKNQLGIVVENSSVRPGFQKTYFGGEKPAFYLYFNMVGDKGFIHISQMGVKPIK